VRIFFIVSADVQCKLSYSNSSKVRITGIVIQIICMKICKFYFDFNLSNSNKISFCFFNQWIIF
jgi:hypothetical protein